MEKAYFIGKMVISMRAIGSIIQGLAQVYFHGQTATNMKEILLII